MQGKVSKYQSLRIKRESGAYEENCKESILQISLYGRFDVKGKASGYYGRLCIKY